MKKFREYINEEMMPYAQTEKGFVGVDNGPVRDNINLLLATVTERPHATPYHALEVIRKVLAPFHIFPPATNFLDGDGGHEIFQINQFGEKVGMTNSGDVVTKDSSPYFLYFEYSMNSRGSFDIFSEIVNQDELEEILDDVEDEIEDDTTTGNGEDAEDTFDSYKADNKLEEDLNEACWDGYRQVGTKKKGNRRVPNCVPVSEEKLNEIGDTKKGKVAINRVALRGDAEIADQAIKKRPNKKVLAKAERAVDLSIATHKRRGGNVLGGYLKHAYGIKEEQLDELSKKKLGDYVKKSSLRKAQDSADMSRIQTSGNPEGAALYKKMHRDVTNRSKGISRANAKLTKEETLDEQSKARLANYIKQASHDVAARSAAVRGFARDADDQRKSGKAMDARKSDERADKMFKKSWNRRKYMAKAVDKLTTEAKDSYAAYQRRMGMNTEKASKKEGEWSKKIKKQEKEAAKKSNKLTTEAQSADTHTGALTYKGKPVVSPTATSVQPTFPPKNVPVPKPRPANLEESNPAREGAIAAGYKGSNPAEQGSIAVKKDDEDRANFKVAKKLARKATKEIIKKKKS